MEPDSLSHILGQFQSLEAGEIVVTNEKTGGKKASKLQRYDLIPWEAMDELAAVYGFGATKYAPHNWRKGYDWGLSYASLIRHAKAFWAGEELDPESGLPHMAHAAWHCLTLLTFVKEHPDLDDRFTSVSKSESQRIGESICAP
jgi:hypothetical protein